MTVENQIITIHSLNVTTLILDLDGVLITTPTWKSDDMHADGYSDFNVSCVSNLNELLSSHDFEIWLSSTRRTKKSLTEFNSIFRNRNISKEIVGFLPVYNDCSNRKEEVEKFITENNLTCFLIIDDDKSLKSMKQEYQNRLVSTDLTLGFNKDKLYEAILMLNKT